MVRISCCSAIHFPTKPCPPDGAAKRPRGATAPRGRIGNLDSEPPRLTSARDGLHRRLRRALHDGGRRGCRRSDRAAGRRQDHRLPHHGVAAHRPVAARRSAARHAGRRTGRLAHWCTPGRLAADRRRIARVAANRGATGPPMMPMATCLGVPRNRHHSHAGERSNQPQKNLASHGRKPSLENLGMTGAAPTRDSPSRGPETIKALPPAGQSSGEKPGT